MLDSKVLFIDATLESTSLNLLLWSIGSIGKYSESLCESQNNSFQWSIKNINKYSIDDNDEFLNNNNQSIPSEFGWIKWNENNWNYLSSLLKNKNRNKNDWNWNRIHLNLTESLLDYEWDEFGVYSHTMTLNTKFRLNNKNQYRIYILTSIPRTMHEWNEFIGIFTPNTSNLMGIGYNNHSISGSKLKNSLNELNKKFKSIGISVVWLDMYDKNSEDIQGFTEFTKFFKDFSSLIIPCKTFFDLSKYFPFHTLFSGYLKSNSLRDVLEYGKIKDKVRDLKLLTSNLNNIEESFEFKVFNLFTPSNTLYSFLPNIICGDMDIPGSIISKDLIEIGDILDSPLYLIPISDVSRRFLSFLYKSGKVWVSEIIESNSLLTFDDNDKRYVIEPFSDSFGVINRVYIDDIPNDYPDSNVYSNGFIKTLDNFFLKGIKHIQNIDVSLEDENKDENDFLLNDYREFLKENNEYLDIQSNDKSKNNQEILKEETLEPIEFDTEVIFMKIKDWYNKFLESFSKFKSTEKIIERMLKSLNILLKNTMKSNRVEYISTIIKKPKELHKLYLEKFELEEANYDTLSKARRIEYKMQIGLLFQIMLLNKKDYFEDINGFLTLLAFAYLEPEGFSHFIDEIYGIFGNTFADFFIKCYRERLESDVPDTMGESKKNEYTNTPFNPTSLPRNVTKRRRKKKRKREKNQGRIRNINHLHLNHFTSGLQDAAYLYSRVVTSKSDPQRDITKNIKHTPKRREYNERNYLGEGILKRKKSYLHNNTKNTPYKNTFGTHIIRDQISTPYKKKSGIVLVAETPMK